MEYRDQVAKIIKNHCLWALGAGLLPVPLLDLAAVTAIQMDMLRQLADLYKVDFSKSQGKFFVSGLTGSTLAGLGASVVKAIPGLGSVLGGVSMSVLSGASTYAVGHVAATHFEANGTLDDVDFKWAREKYREAVERGKEVVSDWQKKESRHELYEALVQLGELKEKGLITEEEFEAKKRALLDQF